MSIIDPKTEQALLSDNGGF